MALSKNAIAEIIGSLWFIVGAVFFALVAYVEDWLLFLRLGCGIWIPGCMCYCFAPLSHLANLSAVTWSETFNDFFIMTAMLSFIIGCVLPFWNEEQVLVFLPLMNALFMYAASACFAVSAKNFCVMVTQEPGCKLFMPRVFELLSGGSFCMAALVGGYAPDSGTVAFGLWWWTVGSIFGLLSPLSLEVFPCLRSEKVRPQRTENQGPEMTDLEQESNRPAQAKSASGPPKAVRTNAYAV